MTTHRITKSNLRAQLTCTFSTKHDYRIYAPVAVFLALQQGDISWDDYNNAALDVYLERRAHAMQKGSEAQKRAYAAQKRRKESRNKRSK